jgi:hypothetical protein
MAPSPVGNHENDSIFPCSTLDCWHADVSLQRAQRTSQNAFRISFYALAETDPAIHDRLVRHIHDSVFRELFLHPLLQDLTPILVEPTRKAGPFGPVVRPQRAAVVDHTTGKDEWTLNRANLHDRLSFVLYLNSREVWNVTSPTFYLEPKHLL